MHYHYVPQMPGDGRNAYCENHVPQDDLQSGMVYVCDCESNTCVVCEELDFQMVCTICKSVILPEQFHIETANWNAHMECAISWSQQRYGRSSTYGKVENP